jgi:endonuclease/exonuclease/phosphatase family metal-dependent hydrolase
MRLSVLLFCSLLAPSASAQWNPPTGQWGKVDNTDLRVMTYNIEDAVCSSNAKVEGQNDWCGCARLIAAFKPDVLVLEECGDNTGEGTGTGIDSVANLTATINMFLHGGLDTYHGSTPITSWVQKYAPAYDLPYVYVSTENDSFNRNVILSRYPFTDLNGDTKSAIADIPTVTANGYAQGGDGGLRGFAFAEIDLPNGTYLGNLVVGGAHLKAGGQTPDHDQRITAATNVAYVVRNWWNGNGGATPDPSAKIADVPAATTVLDANTPVVMCGDWNEDELANGVVRGPADWLTQALTPGGTSDGTDRDGTDMTTDAALNFFTGSDASHSSGDKFDYIAYQDSIATFRLSTIFISGSTPAAAQPPEVAGFTGGASSVTSTASDHRPVFVDLRLPVVDCNGNNVADSTDIALGNSLDVNLNQVPDECECLMNNYCVLSPNSVGSGAVIGGSGFALDRGEQLRAHGEQHAGQHARSLLLQPDAGADPVRQRHALRGRCDHSPRHHAGGFVRAGVLPAQLQLARGAGRHRSGTGLELPVLVPRRAGGRIELQPDERSARALLPVSEKARRQAVSAKDLGFTLLVGACAAPALWHGARGEPDPIAALVWVSLIAVPGGWVCGARGMRLWPLGVVVPVAWMIVVAFADAMSARDLPAIGGSALAVVGLFGVGFALAGRRNAWPWRGAAVIWLVVVMMAALPLAGLALREAWKPAVAARVLDLAPTTLVAEAAGLDWMRHPPIYDGSSTVDIDRD